MTMNMSSPSKMARCAPCAAIIKDVGDRGNAGRSPALQAEKTPQDGMEACIYGQQLGLTSCG